MDLAEITEREFTQRVRDALKTDDLIATRQLIESVKQEGEEAQHRETVKIYAERYILQIRDGEQYKDEPTISDIEQWIEAKGLSGTLEPWAVLNSIKQNGTTWDRIGGSAALKEVINPEIIQRVMDIAVQNEAKKISGTKWL
jgi:hypothetical protein